MPYETGILPPVVSQEAVQHYCLRKWAVHLDDVMLRRTSWRYYHPDHLEIAQRVAEWMRAELAWSPEQAAAELSRYRDVTSDHDVPSEPRLTGEERITLQD